MAKHCLVVTKEIKELANKLYTGLQGQPHIDLVKAWIEMWLDKNNKSMDEYPTAAELNKFRSDLNKQDKSEVKTDENAQLKSTLSIIDNAIKSGLWTVDSINQVNNLVKKIKNGKINFKRTVGERFSYAAGISEAHAGASIIIRGEAGTSQEKYGNPQTEYGKDAEQGKRQEKIIEAWAKAADLWLNDYTDEEGNKANTLEDLLNSQWHYMNQGSEAEVFEYDDTTVLKSINLSHTNDNIANILDRIALFNNLFPETALSIVAFGRDSLGHFRVITLQKHIEGTELTDEDLKKFHDKYKFEKFNDWFSTPDKSTLVTDVSPSNILKDKNGNFFVIDLDVVYNTPRHGGNVQYNNEPITIAQDTEAGTKKFLASDNQSMLENALLSDMESGLESSSVFNIPEIEKTDLRTEFEHTFDYAKIRDRSRMMARAFMYFANEEYNRMKQDLEQRLAMPGLSYQEKSDLNNDLETLTVDKAINKLTPQVLFNKVKEAFEMYNYGGTHQERVDAELSFLENADISEEEKLKIAERNANYRFSEYEKVLKFFPQFLEHVVYTLDSVYRKKIGINYKALREVTEVDYEEYDDDGTPKDTEEDGFTEEEKLKEAWTTSERNTASYSTLSQDIRDVINDIPRLDRNGEIELDDLGYPRYLDPNYVHAQLAMELSEMLSPEEMIPFLRRMGKHRTWANQIADYLEQDSDLFSQFYRNYRKDFTTYWIQKTKKNKDGTFKIVTVPVNTTQGIDPLLDEWRDNHMAQIHLDEDSVYYYANTTKGSTKEEHDHYLETYHKNMRNADKGEEIIKNLYSLFNKVENQEEVITLLDTPEVWNNILKTFHMLGIDPNPEVLRDVFSQETSKDPNFKIKSPRDILLDSLHDIFKYMKRDGVGPEEDLINKKATHFKNIATVLRDASEAFMESSFREAGKSYYSFNTPNFLGKIVKTLKNSEKHPETFNKLIESYQKDDFFYKDGMWLNSWLGQMATNPKTRKMFDHKVLLNFDKKEYGKWDGIEYTQAILSEFFSDPNEKTAYYYFPVLSDAPSGEFIKFKRYDVVHYKEEIIDDLVKLVKQEYGRIMKVIARDEEAQKNPNNITKIEGYDIERNKDGKVVKLGGSIFKFLPKLNSFRDKATGLNFVDTIKQWTDTKTDQEVVDSIKVVLEDLMESEFEEEYKKWHKMGLFEEKDGKYTVFNFESVTEGQSKRNAFVVQALNSAKATLGSKWSPKMEMLVEGFSKNYPMIDKNINKIFNDIKQALEETNISQELKNSINRNLVVKNSAKNILREFFYNNTLAQSQIIQIFGRDLAFYGKVEVAPLQEREKYYTIISDNTMEDFQKRIKQVHSPTSKLNVLAKYKGQRVGKTYQRAIYIQDDFVVSQAKEDVKNILDERVKDGKLPSLDRDYIMTIWNKAIDVTDGQSFRSLPSFREIFIMKGGVWNEDLERATQNFINGTWDIRDFNVIYPVIKPFMFTHNLVDSGIEGRSQIGVPVQNKSSEFMMLAIYNLVAGNTAKSEKLKAINEFITKNNIDVVHFSSVVKVGNQGSINLNGKNAREEILEALNQAIKTPTGEENPNVVHTTNYEDYGISLETPEKLTEDSIVSSQLRRIIVADLDPESELTVGDKTAKVKDWIKTYAGLLNDNIQESFNELKQTFKDKAKLSELLISEVHRNPNYGVELAESFTLKDGDFIIPLFDPVQSIQVQNLLTALFKNRITRMKAKIKSHIQVSNYGLTDELNIRFKNANDEFIFNEKEWNGESKVSKNNLSLLKAAKEKYNTFENYLADNKGESIAYAEVYLPAYSRRMISSLLKEDSHILDIDNLPEDLRKAIGYRVPLEGKYSTMPIYIKGFLPQQNGHTVMLPADWVKISGSDFDVDKLYIYLPEFYTEEYDFQRMKKDYEAQETSGKADKIMQTLNSLFNDSLMGDTIEALSKAPESFKEWMNANKEKYRYETPKLKKVRYNTEDTKKNNRQQRNNFILDMMYSILTSKQAASQVLNPGGFDEIKRTGLILNVLTQLNSKKLANILKLETVDNKQIVDKLLKMNISQLRKLTGANLKPWNPLAPSTQVHFYRQNSVGKTLVATFALHGSSHALYEHTNIRLNDNGTFVLNGKPADSLHEVYNQDGQLISKNNASYLNAAVDTAKDPVLADLNINEHTSDIIALLSRAGYKPIEIGLFMRQPIVEEIINAYTRKIKDGTPLDVIIDDILESYKNKNMVQSLKVDNNIKEFYVEDLATNLLTSQEINDVTNAHQISDGNKLDYFKNQLAIGYLFRRIQKSADALARITRATRADSQNGAAGPDIATMMNRKLQLEQLYNEVSTSSKFPISNIKILDFGDKKMKNDEELRESIDNSPLPQLQGFQTYGIGQVGILMEDLFPQFQYHFNKILSEIMQQTRANRLNQKLINAIYEQYLTYVLSDNSFFGADDNFTSFDRRNEFINNFPNEFTKIRDNNPNIAELEFIRQLTVVKPNRNNPVSTLVFNNAGTLNKEMKAKYRGEWRQLLYIPNPEAAKLALNLLRYSYFRSGLGFGPHSFGHLAPIEVRLAIPGYSNALKKAFDNIDVSNFIGQFLRNNFHLKTTTPLQNIDTSAVRLVDKNKFPLETVVIDVDNNPAAKTKNRAAIISSNGENTIYRQSFATSIGGSEYYYMLVDPSNGTYKLTKPLGYKYSFQEYEINKPWYLVESALEINGANYDPDSRLKEYAYDLLQDAEMDEETLSYYLSSIENDLSEDEYLFFNEASKIIFNRDLGLEESSKESLANFELNQNWKDDEGLEPCTVANL